MQLSVWDHQRRHANTCNGGFSFAIEELFDRGSISGWFKLLPFKDGRTRYQVHKDEQLSLSPAPALSVPEVSVSSANVTPSANDIGEKESRRRGPLPPPPVSALSPSAAPPIPPPDDDDDDDERAGASASAEGVKGEGFTRTASQRGDDGVEPPSNLKRSNSITSLQSVAAADVVSADVVEGEVCLEISTADRFSAKPTITVKVIGAQHLVMKEP